MLLYMRKSTRKNSKLEMISHYDNGSNGIEYIARNLESCISAMERLKTDKIICKAYASIVKNVSHKAINGDFTKERFISLPIEEREFYSLESFILWLWNVYSIEHVESTLSSEELFNSNRIKYIINGYYDGKRGAKNEQ